MAFSLLAFQSARCWSQEAIDAAADQVVSVPSPASGWRSTAHVSMTFKEESKMTIASQGSARDLPQALKIAQEAMLLPDVQEMLRKLSDYQLGIFMPHMHGEASGEFQPLPEGILQVESGLEVSSLTADAIVSQTNRFLLAR